MSYNPIGRETGGVYAFPVTSDSFEVLDEFGDKVAAQVSNDTSM